MGYDPLKDGMYNPKVDYDMDPYTRQMLGQAAGPAPGAPAALTPQQESYKNIGSAGIQAAGQTFAQIMQAIAAKQALEAQQLQNEKNIGSSETIAGSRLKTAGEDADAKLDMNAIAQLLKFGQQQTATDTKRTGLGQMGTDAVTSGLLSAFRKGK